MAKVKGTMFSEAVEKMNKIKDLKKLKSMDTAGISTLFDKSETKKSCGKIPKLKGQKKKSNLITKGKKVI